MDEELNFSLSYEQLTAITESYICECIRNSNSAGSRDESIIEVDWARACLDHWHLLAQASHAPIERVNADRLRMTNLIWCYPTEERRV